MVTESAPAALIFDLDGTLLDTEPLYTQAAQVVLDEFGATYTNDLKRRTMGGDSHASAQIVIDEFNLPLTTSEYLSLREGHLLDLFATAAEIPGAGEFVIAAAAAGLTLGLATSSHRHLRDVKLGRREWSSRFATMICGDDERLKRGKPAPDIFLLCAETLGVDPARCIAFEDSGNGIAAAAAAGMQVVAINSPFVSAENQAEASQVIEDFHAAMPWLTAWQQ